MDAVFKPNTMGDDSDDEDLEALRLAALQSIKSKPTVVAPRRRPKPIGRPNRGRIRQNFSRGCVNTNLISIVPMELPVDTNETPKPKSNDSPPPLVLPQDRYCKTDVKSSPPVKETQVSSKFSRFEDSNSGDSDDDIDYDFGDESSDTDKQGENTELQERLESESVVDDDELLLQDEDSLGKFFPEFDEEDKDEQNAVRVKTTSVSSVRKTDVSEKPPSKVEAQSGKDSDLDIRDKGVSNERSLSRKESDSKTSILGKRLHDNPESGNSNGENISGSKNHLHGSSLPTKKPMTGVDEDSKRINRPCITGRNRSPSPARSKHGDRYSNSPSPVKRRYDSPLKRRPSPPSPGSLSPLCKREVQYNRINQTSGKSSHPSRSLPSRTSPQDVTPPSYWGSRSNSSRSYSQNVQTREWSSSPHKWSGSHTLSSLPLDSSKNTNALSTSPPRQSAFSNSPRKGSRIRGRSRSLEREWSSSPLRKKHRDYDTSPDSRKPGNDGGKISRRKSTSPSRLRDRPKLSDSSTVTRRISPVKRSSRSPLKAPRNRSSARSLSRTPSLSPSPEPEGKLSARNYRRHKSPLRLPGYRLPVNRDGRTFRQDGKGSRKDGDRQHAVRLNGRARKTIDSKLEIPKTRPLNSRVETKIAEKSPQEKVDVMATKESRAKSPVEATLPSSWSSDDGGESDSESRFKSSDSKVMQTSVVAPKIASSAVPMVRDSGDLSSSDRKSPKRKKSKRSKKSVSKSRKKEDDPDEPKAKRTNDVDLRAELSRRRAERVSKAKNNNINVPVRLVQSALQSLTSKSNSVDGERSSLKSYATKCDAGSELSVAKKKPIHLRLGLPVARNPDPPEPPVSAHGMLPRLSSHEKVDVSDPASEGGNVLRKVKLKRNVTVQKSLPRGTSSTNSASGKEQV